MQTKSVNRIILGLLSAALVFAWEAFAETYTVTTDGGTYASPVSLDSLTVTDSTSATMTFAEAAAKFAEGDTFVKAGTGYVLSSSDMSKLKGATSSVKIEDGCFIFSATYQLGGATDTSSNTQKAKTSPVVTVSDGATLALKTSAKVYIYNPIRMQGRGLAGLGAFCIDSSISQTDYLTYGSWTLLDDTLVTTKAAQRYDLYGGWTLGSHTLTFKANGAEGQIGVYGTWMTPGASGKLVFDGVVICDISANWNGSADNVVMATNAANWRMYTTTAKPKWSLVWNATKSMEVNNNGYSGGWGGESAYNGWTGPVRLDADWRFFGNSGTTKGVWYEGNVSGKGGFLAQNAWLHLRGASNTYEGKTIVLGPGAGLGLYHPGSVSLNGAGYAITNAPVRMATAENYDLPKSEIFVKADGTREIAGGTGGTIAALRKVGPGELVVSSPLAVTGTLELAEGKLTLAPPIAAKLYSAAPGLWEGYINTNGTTGSKAWSISTMEDGNREVSLDKVVAKPAMMQTKAYPPWKDWETITYSGYIWNRTATNETWTFAFACAGYYKFYWNGAQWASSNADDGTALTLYTVTVTPGAHQVIYKGNVRAYRNGISGTAGGKWPANFGWALDRSGRKSTSSSDYIFPMNGAYGTLAGGDGFLLTRDARDVTDFTAEELSPLRRQGQSISNCIVRAGTILDLAATNGVDAAVTFASFTGANTITNGSIRFAGDWRMTTDEKAAWPLKVTNGDVTFVEGATLSIDDPRGIRGANLYDILTVSGEIRGLPELTEELAAVAKLRVKPGDPRTLQLERRRKGLIVVAY